MVLLQNAYVSFIFFKLSALCNVAVAADGNAKDEAEEIDHGSRGVEDIKAMHLSSTTSSRTLSLDIRTTSSFSSYPVCQNKSTEYSYTT